MIATSATHPYDVPMNELSLPQRGNLLLLIDPRNWRKRMLALIAHLAVDHHVRVLDMANSFDAHALARPIRRQTAELDEVLANIRYVRADTAIEVIESLRLAPADNRAVFVLDLLNTLYDDSIDTPHAYQLLTTAIGELNRLRANAPVVVSARPQRAGLVERAGLLTRLRAAADSVHDATPQPTTYQLVMPLGS